MTFTILSASTSNQTTTQATPSYPKQKKSHSATSSSSTHQPCGTQKSDSYVPSSKTEVKGLYTKSQKLTEEQIQALKDTQAESKRNMIELFTQSLFEGQSTNSKLTSSHSSILDKLINACHNTQFNLPELATTPEEAEAALTGDGAYSVDSVATRIMDMATSFAGNNPEKLELMRQAVQKGFAMAGTTFSDITKEKDLPQICQDTYTEIMKRFDDLQTKSEE